MLQVGVTPSIFFPARSRAISFIAMTSPCLALMVPGVTSIEEIVLGATSTITDFSTLSTLAVMVARPGALPVTSPSWLTEATRLAELRQRAGSDRGSPTAEKVSAVSRML